MSEDGNATEMYFQYVSLQEEVQCIVAELTSQLENNPSYQHVWQVYQKVIEFEQRQREVSDLIYDSLPQIMPEYQPAGQSQTLLNDRQAVLVGNEAINVYESVTKMVKQIKDLAIRNANATTSDDERVQIHAQWSDLDTQISDVLGGSTSNGIPLANTSAKPQTVQVGINNTTNDQQALALKNMTVIGELISKLSTTTFTTAGNKATWSNTSNEITLTTASTSWSVNALIVTKTGADFSAGTRILSAKKSDGSGGFTTASAGEAAM